MSAKRLRLDHPAVMVGVVAGLIAVAAFNVWTFRLGSKSYQADPGGELAVRAEGIEALSDLMASVESENEGAATLARIPESFKWPSGVRDPFGIAQAAEDLPPLAEPKQEGWRCEAVVMMGSDLIAMIDGNRYRIGDLVRGAVILAIDKEGVTLLDGGNELRLGVAESLREETALKVVLADHQSDNSGTQGHGEHGGKP